MKDIMRNFSGNIKIYGNSMNLKTGLFTVMFLKDTLKNPCKLYFIFRDTKCDLFTFSFVE